MPRLGGNTAPIVTVGEKEAEVFRMMIQPDGELITGATFFELGRNKFEAALTIGKRTRVKDIKISAPNDDDWPPEQQTK